jgi:hypothetical protein
MRAEARANSSRRASCGWQWAGGGTGGDDEAQCSFSELMGALAMGRACGSFVEIRGMGKGGVREGFLV